METKEIFSNWRLRKCFQNGDEANIFKMDTKKILLKWRARKYF